LTEIGVAYHRGVASCDHQGVRDEALRSAFRGDTTVVRSAHGVDAVRRVTRVSNDIAIHALEVDVVPSGPAWAQVASETHARLSIVLDAVRSGRVESRLRRDQAPPGGPFTMNFAPPGAEVWGYSQGIRRVRDIRLDFDLGRVAEALGEKLSMPEPRVFHSERLRSLAGLLAAECHEPDRFSSLYIDSLTLAVCIDFLRIGSNSTRRVKGGLAPSQLRRVTEYLTNHIAEAVLLRDLAAMTGLSQSQFGRAFKASTGLAPHQWQLKARVARAQELLLLTDSPLSEIALLTGFSEQSHFSRVFKSVTGTSPGVWQRNYARRIK
jgi:AraC family transcriptional regulator